MTKTIVLTDEQKNVVKTFLKFLLDPKEKYLIIQGAAGTGKTTLIHYMLEALEKQYKLFQMLLCKDPDKGEFQTILSALTNKAAAVLRSMTDNEVKTIHASLGLKVVKNFRTGSEHLATTNQYQTLYNKLIIIDEASMMDTSLYYELDRTAIDSKIVLIGDHYQLAPVGQKESIMESLDCPKVTMSKVMRHAGTILETASQFRKVVETGLFQDIPVHENVIQVDGPDFQNQIDSAFLDPKYKINKAKVLAWSNERVQEYNGYIRKVQGYPEKFEEGETVITNNAIIAGKKGNCPTDSEVTITYMGSPGINKGVNGCWVGLDDRFEGFMPFNYADAKVLLRSLAQKAKRDHNWKPYFHVKDTWLDLRSAYANTVHKSQGSSYEKVFIDLADIGRCNIASDVARMLYVSISRATDEVILYGTLPPRYRGQMAA